MERLHRRLSAAIIAYLLVFGLDEFWSVPLARGVHALNHLSHSTGTAAGIALVALIVAATLSVWLWVAFEASRLRPSGRAAAAMAVIGAAAWVALTFFPPIRWLRAHPVWADPYRALGYLCLALASTFLGLVISTVFRDRNLVAAGAVVGGLVDFWGVHSANGTTRDFIQNFPALHHQVSVHLPAMTVPRMGLVDPMVGPGDYVFVGIMFALVHRFDLNPVATARLMLLFLFLAMLGVVLGGWSVPAVAPMAAAVILPNLREFKFKREEIFALLYGAAILAAAAIGWWAVHRHA